MSESVNIAEFGESWLFYGCRHKEQDFLYRLFDDFTIINRRLLLLIECSVADYTLYLYVTGRVAESMM